MKREGTVEALTRGCHLTGSNELVACKHQTPTPKILRISEPLKRKSIRYTLTHQRSYSRHDYDIVKVSSSIALSNMADTAEEPLMAGRAEDENDEVDLGDVSLLLEKNLKHPGIFVWLLTFSAGISGLLFGC